MQIFFSARCPLFNKRLSLGMRILYASSCWSYVTNTLAIPLTIMVPFLAMVFGVLPFVMNFWFALSTTFYLIVNVFINSFCKKVSC